MSTRKVVLCADDYAMSAGVSRAVLELADRGRISATSAMTNVDDWPIHARDLRGFDGRLGIGLHLTLTWGAPLAAMPVFAPTGRFPDLGAVLRTSLAGRLPTDEIETEIARQWRAFMEAFGREPDFVDGHQHVHVLPGIRAALLRVLARRSDQRRVWLRDPRDRPGSVLGRPSAAKALLVGALATGLRAQVGRAGLATNRGFSGFSDFRPDRDLGQAFERYLTGLGERPLVMCHPGHVEADDDLDGVTEARRREFDYLGSPAFGDLLRRQGLELATPPLG